MSEGSFRVYAFFKINFNLKLCDVKQFINNIQDNPKLAKYFLFYARFDPKFSEYFELISFFTFFYIRRRKYRFRANFRFPVFDRLTCFGMS